jgi:D-tyrosyl-tRNA(Tyr) deacylase
MRIVLQRVLSASVEIDQKIVGAIKSGLLIYVGIEASDTQEDADWLAQKIYSLRIFSDHEGKMNVSIADTKGEFLVVSQFTLFAATKKGNRPSFIRSAQPTISLPLYNYFVEKLGLISGLKVATGEFGADMKIKSINDGPVTLFIDSKNKE